MSLATSNRKESAHDRLLNAAAILFYNDGIAATGRISPPTRSCACGKTAVNNCFNL